MNHFGEHIRQLRECAGMLQRQIAHQLDIDAPMLSKIERGERKAKKEHVVQLAEIFKINRNELLTPWLADQVYEIVKDEDVADDVLKSVSKKIKRK